MVTQKNHILIIILLFRCFNFLGQGEANQWIFGNYGALNFNTTPPSVVTNSTFLVSEGGSTISDASGNLILYTDGLSVWNQSHTVIANGTGLLGNQSTTQSCIILKKPGPGTLYYVFTLTAVAGQDGLRYSTVDMSLAAGAGSVIVKNSFLYAQSCEKLHAVKHCNGSDYWIVSHEYNTSVFRAYLLTNTGVNPTPILSAVGSTVGLNSVLGQLKISPNGKKLAMARFQGTTMDLFDFDSSTGVVSNHIPLPNPNGSYNCEFSPDGTKLYGGGGTVYQWEVCSSNSTAVISSSFAVFYSNSLIGSMQLATNGKIYTRAGSTSSLSVITQPNLPGAACGFSANAQPVGNCTLQLGLPNFPANSFRSAPSFSHTGYCSSVTFSVPNIGGGCTAAPSYTSCVWSFGDPASGILNTSTQSIVTHSFAAQGIYTISLKVFSSCGVDSVNVVLPLTTPPTPTVFGTSPICAGQTATIIAWGALSYSWGPTAYTGSSVVVTPSVTTQYTVVGSNNGCASSPTVFQVNVNTSPNVSLQSSSVICPGQNTTLTAIGASTYTWSTGGSGNSIVVTPTVTTTYTATGSNFLGCQSTQTIQAIVYPAPLISITNPSAICLGETATITASGALYYTWSPPNTGSAVVLSPTITTNFLVTGTSSVGCQSTQTAQVIVNPVPQLSITGPSSICAGQSATFVAGGAPNYTWNPNIISSTLICSPVITSTIILAGTNAFGCLSTLSQLLYVFNQAPLAIVGPTFICAGEQHPYFVSGGTSYTWSNGFIGNINLFSPTIPTTLMVNSVDGNGCTSASTVFIHVALCEHVSEYNTLPVKVFPNPSTGDLVIAGAESDIELVLVDPLGKIVETIALKHENKFVIKLQKLAVGVYYLHESKPGSESIKVVVTR